ncbi:MAG: primosomal protein N' [Chloroflexi bacterium]|nr:primosomal protein N' [Chloroflexota bacterium]
MPYAEVAVDAPIRGTRTFTYSIPPEMTVAPGQMVQVPFGPRMADGVVMRLSEATTIDPVKPIARADELGPVLDPEQLDLAGWISDYYLSPLYDALTLMLPPGSRGRTVTLVLRPDAEALAGVSSALRERILAQFPGRRQRLREDILRRRLGQGDQHSLDRLLRRGTLTRAWLWRRLTSPATLEAVQPGPEPQEGEPPFRTTPEQSHALEEIAAALGARSYKAFLLQGVTGSGKTEVYLQALAACIAGARRGIVLVPEISLTPQTVRQFQARFPGQVAVLHSRLSPSEHRSAWWGITRGQYQVVVGSRSALFAPLRPLGLVVLDEEHEWTYKQHDRDPRYHARTVAQRLAQQVGATVVLGSATPDVAVYHRAALPTTSGRLTLLELPQRIGGHQATPMPLAQVEVVDMRRELREGHRGIFSRRLQRALQETLGRGEQAILFINRRGESGIVQCRDCGHVMRCAGCDVPLTYHSATDRLVCHQCNRRRLPVARCPKCRSPRIRRLGLGTQRVVAELEALHPGVAVLRWDRDVAAGLQAQDGVLERFARGEAQVLVGTQMVTKGLHVPSVTLVGVVLADIGLHLPDFRSSERAFQLLCQVAGRAGRGGVPGTAIIQTYRPDHYAVALAAHQDYGGFYRNEIAFRRRQRLPPFSRMVRLVYAHTNAALAEREAARMGRALRQQQQAWGLEEVELMGPAPAYPLRVRGRYRWHILLRGPGPRLLLDKVEVPDGWVVDVDPISVV